MCNSDVFLPDVTNAREFSLFPRAGLNFFSLAAFGVAAFWDHQHPLSVYTQNTFAN
jgi:hypothetical protein